MSISAIGGSLLSLLSGPQAGQSNPFQQIQNEFQTLGQDLQSGNLNGAQQVFSQLSQTFSGANQTGSATSSSPLAQAFQQLGQDLQSGNLQGAQQDFNTLQQDVQQSVQQAAGHHHHHFRPESSSQNSSASQLTSSISQEFSQLAQSLQGGNLQGAQQAFSTLQNDLQQIASFTASGSSGLFTSPVGGSVNVSA